MKKGIAGHHIVVGTIKPHMVLEEPTGWLICDGRTVPTASYPELFAVIGYNFGGSGASFALPNFSDRFVKGRVAEAIGSCSGCNTPSHCHVVPAHYHCTCSGYLYATATCLNQTNCATGVASSVKAAHSHTAIHMEFGHVYSLNAGPPGTYTQFSDRCWWESGYLWGTSGNHFHAATFNANISHTHSTSCLTGDIGCTTTAIGDSNLNSDTVTPNIRPRYMATIYLIKY